MLACAAALAAVLTLEAPAPVALLFLVMIGFIAFIVSVYSLGYMAHAHRQGWYWFFLLLTFASLAGIVSTPDMAAMYGYWELMTFASYFLVVHEADRVAFDAGFKYYLMCAGGAPADAARHAAAGQRRPGPCRCPHPERPCSRPMC